MIKAIIFDCFGVLVRDGWLPYKERHFAHNSELFKKATELNHMTDAHLLGYDDFIREVAKLADIPADLARTEIEDNPPNTRMFEWIRDDLKPHYKIGLLSNAATDWLDSLFEPWQVELFDEKVLSYQIGTTKPDPRMYQAVIERLGVTAEECVFIDDNQSFCEAAQALGMHTVHYQDNLHFIKEIRKFNVFLNENLTLR